MTSSIEKEKQSPRPNFNSKSGNFCKNPRCKKDNCKDIFCGVQREVPIFVQLNSPHKEVHACFYYYLIARRMLEEKEGMGGLIYEDQDNPSFEFTEVAKRIANLYEVPLETMLNCWSAIDAYCEYFKLPKLPDIPKYRLSNTKIIIT